MVNATKIGDFTLQVKTACEDTDPKNLEGLVASNLNKIWITKEIT